MKISGVIFDMDGTILDSMKIWDTVASDYLLSLGKTPREGLRETLWPMSLMQAAEYMRESYDISFSPEEIVEGIDSIIEDFYENTAPAKHGALELLEMLNLKGVKMVLATATNRKLVEGALRRTGMLKYFIEILTCGEVGFSKKEPEIFLKAHERLNTPKEETYVFEDALFAIQTAKNAGFKVVAVSDESSKHCAGEIRALADIYVDSLDEIKEML